MEVRTKLDELGELFSQWRSKKTSRSERTPKELIQQARVLRGQFSDAEISRRLGIAMTKLNSRKIISPKAVAGSKSSTRVRKTLRSDFLDLGMLSLPSPSEKICIEMMVGSRSVTLSVTSAKILSDVIKALEK